MRSHLNTLSWFLFASAFIFSCVSSDDLPPVTLKGEGAINPTSIISTGTPLTPSWINAFQTLTNGLVSGQYAPSGAGEGESAILGNKVDYAVTSSPLSEFELAKVNGTLLHFPILLGAVDLTYSFPAGTITGTLNLTADLLSAIYQVKISRWDDPLIMAVNPNLNYTGRIVPVARFDPNGPSQVFTNYLSLATVDIPWALPVDKKVPWPHNVTVVLTDNTLVKTVGATPGAIGYTNYGVPSLLNMPTAALRNADGNFVSASQQTILAAANSFEAGGQYPDGDKSWSHVTLCNQPGPNTWPLAHYEFALFYQDLRYMGARGSALVGFMFYILSTQAQDAAPRFKYAPLGNFVRSTNIRTLDSVLIDNDYQRTDYWNPYPPPPVHETHELVQGTIASLVIISVFGVILLVAIVLFGFLQWRQNDIEFL